MTRIVRRGAICEECKKPFRPHRKWQKFCDTRCHDLWWARERKKAMELYRASLEETIELHLVKGEWQ